MPAHTQALQDGDIIFNLRLMNQKMEEELRLYRNGTTPDNLLELIDEKDAEISRLRKAAQDTADKLRRIAKGSKEVISKCDLLQKENDDLKMQEAKRSEDAALHKASVQKQQSSAALASQHQTNKELSSAKQTIQDLLQEVNALQAENETLNNSMDLLIPEADKYQELIEELEDDGYRRDSSIEKLQKRCHNLVLSSKGSRAELETSYQKALQELAKRKEQVILLTAEITKAQAFNATLKERVGTERKNAAQLSTQLLQALSDVTKAQTSEAKMRTYAKTNAAAAATSNAAKASNGNSTAKSSLKSNSPKKSKAAKTVRVSNDENTPPATVAPATATATATAGPGCLTLQEAAAKRKSVSALRLGGVNNTTTTK